MLNQTNSKEVPYELFEGKKPKVSYFKAFGRNYFIQIIAK